jgi:hypothetical protein
VILTIAFVVLGLAQLPATYFAYRACRAKRYWNTVAIELGAALPVTALVFAEANGWRL